MSSIYSTTHLKKKEMQTKRSPLLPKETSFKKGSTIRHARNALKKTVMLGVLLPPSIQSACPYISKSEQMQLKHIEGKGIGYQRGYTTFQAFFSPSHAVFVPLFDFRGHV